MASGAADVRAIAEALGHDSIGIWGKSGGGEYDLGCEALLPDLAVAEATVATLATYGIEGYDYIEGMGEYNDRAIRRTTKKRRQQEEKRERKGRRK